MYSYIHVAQANNTDPGRKKKKNKNYNDSWKIFSTTRSSLLPPPMGGGCTVYGYGIRYIWYMVVVGVKIALFSGE